MHESRSSRFDVSYMRMAQEWSKNSYCKRNKVGALVVKDNAIISDGFNGTPTGFDNCCENDNNETHWHVLHAEANCIAKLAQTTQSSIGSTLYTTMSPCKECAKLILQVGIVRVVYSKEYRDTTGVNFLRKAGICVDQIEIDEQSIPYNITSGNSKISITSTNTCKARSMWDGIKNFFSIKNKK